MAYKKNRVIGLTGGFGSGKSTVLKMFSSLGAKISDADLIVHQALYPTGKAYKKVIALFGAEIIRKGGSLNRKKIAQQIFQSPPLRKKLEGILHPIVYQEFRRVIDQNKKNIIILDIPLLFESKLQKTVDEVVVVWSPLKKRIERLKSKRKFSQADIQCRIQAQWPLEKKCRQADVVIDNSQTLNKTKKQVLSLWQNWQKILSIAKTGPRS